jgi:heme exporter protein C
MFTRYANPERFMGLSAWAMPLCAVLSLVLFAIGLPWALVFSPQDYKQLDAARILYVHVPAAWWGLGVYGFMAVASFMGLVWRHTLADIAARAAAPIGAAFAGLCLATGSLWGAPIWGTWWVWDARLTSMLIVFLTYLAYMALWSAVEDENKAARLAAILCLAGAINLPIVYMSVEWWYTLHQPSSVRSGGLHASMQGPLFTMAGAFLFGFIAMMMANVRAEIYRRRALAAAARRARASQSSASVSAVQPQGAQA